VTGEAIGDILPIAFGVAISRLSPSSSCSVSLRLRVGQRQRYDAKPIGDAIGEFTS
jgi:hypothetical protein